MKLPAFEAFIFDMDGVLIDSENFYTRVEQENFRQLGLHISHEEHVTYQGTATDLMWAAIRERHGLQQPVEELVEMTNARVVPYFQSLDAIPAMPGITELLELLHSRRVPLALASSSYPEIIELVLDKTGLRKYFQVVVNSRLAKSSKPHPAIFLLAAEKLGISPERCVVVEDSTNGIRAAQAAGMFCIAYNGPGAEHQDQSAADWQIVSYQELVAALDGKAS